MKDFTELNLGEYMSCCYRVMFPWHLQVGNELDTRWSERYLRGEKIASKRNRTKCLQSGRTGRILSRWDVQGQLTIHPYIFHQPLGHHCRRQLWTLQDNVCFSEIFFSFPFLLLFLFLWRQVLMSTSVLEISNRFLEIINSFFIQQTCTEWLMNEVGRSWFIQIVKLEGDKITPWGSAWRETLFFYFRPYSFSSSSDAMVTNSIPNFKSINSVPNVAWVYLVRQNLIQIQNPSCKKISEM